MKISTKKKLQFYFLVCILPISVFYLVFITTDFYMPKQKKIENTKQLALTIVNGINKTTSVADTLFLVVDNPFVTCGNETDDRTVFEKKIASLKYAIKSQYYFDKETSFEPIYRNNNSIIVTGRSSHGGEGCYCFNSPNVYFDIDRVKEKTVYEIKYDHLGKNKIDLSLINFNTGAKIKSFSLVLDKNNWILD